MAVNGSGHRLSDPRCHVSREHLNEDSRMKWRASACVLFNCAALLFDEAARAELRPERPGGSILGSIHDRLCYAGRFRFEKIDKNGDVYIGRYVEQMPSSAGHPNAKDLGSVRVVLRGDSHFKPALGKTYCLFLTDGSKRGMTVEAFGSDDPSTVTQMKEIIGSPSAFENDKAWRQRRALWTKFAKDLGPTEVPLIYAEDDACRNILYLKGGEREYAFHLYDIETGRAKPIIHAKVLPGVNRITFEKGAFQVWFNGSVELTIGSRDMQ